MRKWTTRLWLAIGQSFLVILVLFSLYQLYSAWMFNRLYALRYGWILYDDHPIAFWLNAVADGVAVVVLGTIVGLSFRGKRNENGFLRKRETQAPIEHSIRQSSSER